MKNVAMPCAAAALVVLAAAGCSPHQQAEANSQANSAKKQIQQAANRAGRDLSNDAESMRVKTALMTSKQVDSSHITVRTDKGVVYLRGTVPNAQQVALATQIARDTVAHGTRVEVQLKTAAGG